MRAIVIPRFGGPEVLELRQVPTPEPSRGEVRVRIRATALNRQDLLQIARPYPVPADAPQDVPGIEFAGEVDAVGHGVTELVAGDRVFGLAGGGAFAESIVVHARTLAKMPDGLSFTDAAAIPEAFITAYDAMVSQAHLAAGEVVLVHAVGSGVGTAAVQIARAIGASSIGTARTEDKLPRAQALGMTHGLLVPDGKFADEVLSLTGGRGADVILDLVGGSYITEDISCAAPRGRIAIVGLMGGVSAEVPINVVLYRRITIFGTAMRSRPLEEKIAAAQTFARQVVPLIAQGKLTAIVDRIFPLESAADALRHMAKNQSFGKVVLEI
ncbi:NAD(P)H-quinone oxidoreductase [Pendulispora brunnea]|uniref:NAD(P)H-quinone oxidoreductase n=1 Tax=Pendulispora brunnea TaxID=2905690 RepID=A0ABZ2KD31_9BACT